MGWRLWKTKLKKEVFLTAVNYEKSKKAEAKSYKKDLVNIHKCLSKKGIDLPLEDLVDFLRFGREKPIYESSENEDSSSNHSGKIAESKPKPQKSENGTVLTKVSDRSTSDLDTPANHENSTITKKLAHKENSIESCKQFSKPKEFKPNDAKPVLKRQRSDTADELGPQGATTVVKSTSFDNSHKADYNCIEEKTVPMSVIKPHAESDERKVNQEKHEETRKVVISKKNGCVSAKTATPVKQKLPESRQCSSKVPDETKTKNRPTSPPDGAGVETSPVMTEHRKTGIKDDIPTVTTIKKQPKLPLKLKRGSVTPQSSKKRRSEDTDLECLIDTDGSKSMGSDRKDNSNFSHGEVNSVQETNTEIVIVTVTEDKCNETIPEKHEQKIPKMVEFQESSILATKANTTVKVKKPTGRPRKRSNSSTADTSKVTTEISMEYSESAPNNAMSALEPDMVEEHGEMTLELKRSKRGTVLSRKRRGSDIADVTCSQGAQNLSIAKNSVPSPTKELLIGKGKKIEIKKEKIAKSKKSNPTVTNDDLYEIKIDRPSGRQNTLENKNCVSRATNRNKRIKRSESKTASDTSDSTVLKSDNKIIVHAEMHITPLEANSSENPSTSPSGDSSTCIGTTKTENIPVECATEAMTNAPPELLLSLGLKSKIRKPPLLSDQNSAEIAETTNTESFDKESVNYDEVVETDSNEIHSRSVCHNPRMTRSARKPSVPCTESVANTNEITRTGRIDKESESHNFTPRKPRAIRKASSPSTVNLDEISKVENLKNKSGNRDKVSNIDVTEAHTRSNDNKPRKTRTTRKSSAPPIEKLTESTKCESIQNESGHNDRVVDIVDTKILIKSSICEPRKTRCARKSSVLSTEDVANVDKTTKTDLKSSTTPNEDTAITSKTEIIDARSLEFHSETNELKLSSTLDKTCGDGIKAGFSLPDELVENSIATPSTCTSTNDPSCKVEVPQDIVKEQCDYEPDNSEETPAPELPHTELKAATTNEETIIQNPNIKGKVKRNLNEPRFISEYRKYYQKERKRKYQQRKRRELRMKQLLETPQVHNPTHLPVLSQSSPPYRAITPFWQKRPMGNYRPGMRLASVVPDTRLRHPGWGQRPFYHRYNTPSPSRLWQCSYPPSQQNKNLIYVKPLQRVMSVKDELVENSIATPSTCTSTNDPSCKVEVPQDIVKEQCDYEPDNSEETPAPELPHTELKADYCAIKKAEEDNLEEKNVESLDQPFKKMKLPSEDKFLPVVTPDMTPELTPEVNSEQKPPATPQSPPSCSFEDVLPIMDENVAGSSTGNQEDVLSQQTFFSGESKTTTDPSFVGQIPCDFSSPQASVRFYNRSPPLSPSMVYPDTPRSSKLTPESSQDGTTALSEAVVDKIAERVKERVINDVNVRLDKRLRRFQAMQDRSNRSNKAQFSKLVALQKKGMKQMEERISNMLNNFVHPNPGST